MGTPNASEPDSWEKKVINTMARFERHAASYIDRRPLAAAVPTDTAISAAPSATSHPDGPRLRCATPDPASGASGPTVNVAEMPGDGSIGAVHANETVTEPPFDAVQTPFRWLPCAAAT